VTGTLLLIFIHYSPLFQSPFTLSGTGTVGSYNNRISWSIASAFLNKRLDSNQPRQIMRKSRKWNHLAKVSMQDHSPQTRCLKRWVFDFLLSLPS